MRDIKKAFYKLYPIVAESLPIDSEHALFQRLQSDYQDAFPTLIDRSGYNDRRQKVGSGTGTIAAPAPTTARAC